MRYLIDLGHPAHIHFFRNIADQLANEGHDVLFTGREKDILIELSSQYGLDLRVLSKAKPFLLGMSLELLEHQFKILRLVQKFKPHAMLGIAGTFIGLPGFLTGTPTYVFYDTEHATISNALTYPFATCVYVPQCYRNTIRWRHERYNGYHELAYLTPNVFTPDPSVLGEANLSGNHVFSILRFVAWNASHDKGLTGITLENKIKTVRELSRFGPVFISSEGPLPPELAPYRCTVPASRMHHLMAYAALIFGESATMASEAAVLGVPAIFIDAVGRGYSDEQESEYGLVFNFTPDEQADAIDKAVAILSDYDRNAWQERRRRLLNDKVDVNRLLYSVATELPYSDAKK